MNTTVRQLLIIFLFQISFWYTKAQNLIVNPSAELSPVGIGWTQLSGDWHQDSELSPHEGIYYFAPNDNGITNEVDTLFQDVDVTAYSSYIDQGLVTFSYSGYMRSRNQSSYTDETSELVQYRSESGIILSSYDSRWLQNVDSWIHIIDTRVAPVGTRIIRIMLLSKIHSATKNHGFHDDLSLTPNIDGTVNNKTLFFDGVDDYVSVNPSAINNLSQGTIETWIYLNSVNQEPIYAKQHNGYNTSAVLSIGYASNTDGAPINGIPGKIYFHSQNRQQFLTSDSVLQVKKWYHIAISFAPDSAIFYVNGNKAGSVTGNFSIPDETLDNIARIGNWGGDGTGYLNGKLDEFRVWNIARTQEQIVTGMHTDYPQNTPNLSLYYNMNEADTSSVVKDSSSNSSNGVLGFPPQKPVFVPSDIETHQPDLAPVDTCSKYAVSFDGIDDYINADISSTTSYTIEAWVKLSNLSNQNVLVGTRKNSSPSRTYSNEIRIQNGKFIHYLFDNNQKLVTGTTTVNTSSWYHVAATASQNGLMHLYVNGIEEGTPLHIGIPEAEDQFRFGGSAAGLSSFAGNIEEVRIWNTELSQTELQKWMNRHIDSTHPEYSHLTHYYRMEEGYGNTTTDIIGKVDGILTNMDTSVVWVPSNSPMSCNPDTDKQNQAITFTPISPKVFGDTPFVVHATASSRLPIDTLKIISGPGIISHDTVTINGAGKIIVEATQPGNENYYPAVAIDTIEVIKAIQEITSFDAIQDTSSSKPRYILTATASSGLPVKFLSVSGDGQIKNDTIIFEHPGEVIIKAYQNGDNNYSSAEELKTFCVSANPPDSIIGFKQVCKSSQSYSVFDQEGVTFKWSLSEGGTLNSSVGTSVTVTWNDLGTHQLTVSSSVDCNENETFSKSIEVTVTNSIKPDSVTNMYPPSGTVVANIPFSLSWKPGNNSETYDLYIWETGSQRPSTASKLGINQISYTVSQSLLPNFSVGKIYNWQIVARNGCDTAAGAVQNFVISELPNLIASDVDIADTVNSGQKIDFSALITNNGKVSTPNGAQWQDAYYLSIDSLLESSDTYLGAKPNQTALKPDSSYTTKSEATLAENLVGNHYLFCKANAFGGRVTESDLGDNAGYKKLYINPSPTPDLRVDSVVAFGNPFSGQKIPINFTVENYGVATLNDSVWKDYIYISSKPAFSEDSAIKLLEVTHYGKIAKDSAYLFNDSVAIPPYIFGDYYIHVVTDARNDVFERASEENNTGTSSILHIYLTPPPDFIVSSINAQPVAAAGESIKIDYTVYNSGASKPPLFGNNWVDAVFISKYPVFDDNAKRLDVIAPKPLPAMEAGASYYNTVTVKIPNDFEGIAYLYVITDYYKNVFEFNRDDNNTDSTSILINTPDLFVSSLKAQKDTVSSGSNIEINWTVTNAGDGKVLPVSRTDNVWLCTTPQFNTSNANLIGQIRYNSTMDSATVISQQATVQIGLSLSGKQYLFVETDAGKDIPESDENNNFSSAYPVNIILSPTPDLIVTNVTATPDTLLAGNSTYTITYTAENKGIGSITGKSWKDRIYRSTDAVFNSNAVPVTDVSESRTLFQDGTYTETVSFSTSLSDIGNADTATWYFYVYSDIANDIYEADENNNRSGSNSVTVIHNPYADLNVSQANGSDSVKSGKLTNISWTVENIAGSEGLNGYWYDAVLFSHDSQASDDDIFAGSKLISNPFGSNKSYSQLMNITVPNGLTGDYYMLLVTDYTKLNKDVNHANNVRVIKTNIDGTNQDTVLVHVELSPSANLVVDSFSSPSYGSSGQPVPVKWKVSNIGNATVGRSLWNENVYLSTDDKVDGTDKLLQAYIRKGDLAKGESYTDSLQVFLPADITGNYYLLFKTDGNNIVYENNDETDNTATSFIFIAATDPSDLTASDIVIPDTALIGDSIPVTWNLKNIGLNPATGYLRQGIYISKDAIWDKDDILLSDFPAQVNISPSDDSAFSRNVQVSAIQPHGNYIIVRTDLLNNIRETDENNNNGISDHTIDIRVQELPIGKITPETLTNNQPLYYKIIVPDSLAGETLLVSLHGDSLNALNELYIKYDSIPTRINYDFVYPNPVSGSQDIVIPALNKGEYYILAYGATSASSGHQAITLYAEKINFTILSVDAKEGGNTGAVTVQIKGAKFNQNMQAVLKNESFGTYTATRIIYTNSTAVFATFNLNGAKTGTYDVMLIKPGIDTAILTNGFSIVPGSGGLITGGGTTQSGITCNIVNGGVESLAEFNVDVESQVRVQTLFSTVIEIRNNGNVDVPIPPVTLQSLSGAPLDFEATVAELLLGKTFELVIDWVNKESPKGILRPGAKAYSVVLSVLPFTTAHELYKYQLIGQ